MRLRNALSLSIVALFSLLFSLFSLTAARAVATTTCDKDAWQCTEWGACSGESRTRACAMVNDCPNVETPKPAEREACVIGAKGCTSDTWSCEDWQACDARGGQHRDCRMTIDCDGVQTVKPVTDRPCPTLQCDQPDMRDRLSCRLKLEPAGLDREDQIRYMPELCRPMAVKAEQDACVALERSLEPCRKKPLFDDRIACARGVIALEGDLKEKVVACKEMDEPAKGECLADLRKKVYDLVRFRLGDLKDRAAGLLNAGAPFEVVVDVAVAVEENRITFTNATTQDGRVTAVKGVRAAWQTFLLHSKPYLR
ncbi:MAG TPA: hypothetical protein VL500_03770 [Candidatus Eisenbacteria bacterium]|jgi:hypothetical protein|nr:hypothetical protein [Candidatus Eisenbacteria bacterium]